MKFSKRTDWELEESQLSLALRKRMSEGLPLADLTASNPTRCGFNYSLDLLAPLGDAAAFDYDPNPLGSMRAREAVCQYYADHGAAIRPEQVLLTTSTSEAYGYLFKLLCDPGDAVLVPQPGYPLFDYLAGAESVALITAPFLYDHGWQLDLEGVRRQIKSNVRAVVLVHPNNPTGHYTKVEEAEGLAAICREYNLALIVDEVFLDYWLLREGEQGITGRSSIATRNLDIPVFVVSGVSKVCGLPQMKVGWLAAIGPGWEAAMARLEILADTYLSMNAPVQRALPVWLAGREGLQDQIRKRVRRNLEELDRVLSSSLNRRPGGALANRLEIEGGWYAVIRIAAIQPDELTAQEVLKQGVWVHPGYFFGMGESGWLVVSLLTDGFIFADGIAKLFNFLNTNQGSYQ
jgi:aspartate/methionine/tyrosine aminotransferase